MPLTVTAQQIEAQIAQDINACESLISLLDREQEALKNRDPEQLAEIIEAKIAPLSLLETSANERSQWVKASGSEASMEAWQDLLQQTQQQKLKDDWHKLKQLTLECRMKNEVNGKLLVRNQQVYGRLLDLLRGQNTNTNLYTASGAAKGLSGTNIVGEA